MKILHTVEFYFPSKGGAQEVIRQLSERLASFGHEVTVVTSKLPTRDFKELNGVKIEGFDISGNMVAGFSGIEEEIKRYQDFIVNSEFDIIMNYAAQSWPMDLTLHNLENISAKKILVPCGFSGLLWDEYGNYFQQMKAWLKQYDACVYMSNNYRDINFAREFGINNDVFIPNGAGEDEFGPTPSLNIRELLKIPKNCFIVLHVGSHTGTKGHKEAIDIFKKSKIRNATFVLVADHRIDGCGKRCKNTERKHNKSIFSKHSKKQIIIGPLLREQTIAAFHEADLFLFPSEIECSPLVLFEAMASKTAFLTTDVGNAKEIIDWSNGGRLLPTKKLPEGFVKADVKKSAKILEKLYRDTEKRKLLAENGYNAWKKSFTWENVVKQYERLYISLVKAK